MSLFTSLIRSQVWLSQKFDLLLPPLFRIDGNRDFLDTLLPCYLSPSMISDHDRVYDVGGGKQPCIPQTTKDSRQLHVTGIDISSEELADAPKGAYDDCVIADIQDYSGKEDGDLVICQSLLEHVADTEKAFSSLSTLLRPGGKLLLFVPSKHAWFAKLNRLLPEDTKRRLLFAIFPHTKRAQGFRAYYHRCSPKEFRKLALQNNLTVVALHPFYKSSYFSFCFPLYVVWRMWILLAFLIWGEDAAETFSLVLQKNGDINEDRKRSS